MLSNTPPNTAVDYSTRQLEIQNHAHHPSHSFIEFPRAAIEQSIPSRFERQVERYATRPAVKIGDVIWTYDELNRAANRIAHAILAQSRPGNGLPGGTGDAPIVVFLAPGADMLAALLGVLKAGRPYVPFDPSYPHERNRDLLQDTRAEFILTNQSHLAAAQALAQSNQIVLAIDELESYPAENPSLIISPDRMAYILYTSGSTGKPKGVIQTHRNVLHNARKFTNTWHICAQDRQTLLYPSTVYGAARDIFNALLNGACLYVYPLREEGTSRLASWMRAEEITIFCSVATVFRHFVDSFADKAYPDGKAFPSLRVIKLGGERVYTRDVTLFKKHFADHCLLFCGLAATEIGGVRQILIDKETELSGEIVPCGYPVEDMDLLLLDEAGEPVSLGETGEIVIRSRYISTGYWQRSTLTQKAFSTEPHDPNMRLYRTGDLGVLDENGLLMHRGRKDYQVKIRGNRVELPEIEAALFGLDEVKETAVVAHEVSMGELRLVAYVVPVDGAHLTSRRLRQELESRLPHHMVPSYYMLLATLPLTPNGKVDRLALAPPDWNRPQLSSEFVPPQSAEESAVAEIWQTILGVNTIGVQDDFFELGGHSLLATQLLSRLRDAFAVDISLPDFMNQPTIARLVQLVASANRDETAVIPQVSRDNVAPLSFAQQRLWFVDQLQSSGSAYNMHLLFHLEGTLNVTALAQSINEILARHETLRTAFVVKAGRPAQQIMPDVTLSLPVVDLCHSAADSLAEAERLAAVEVNKPFDLTQAPLFRATLFRRDETAYTLLIVTHHIVFDIWSNGVVIQELSALYEAFVNDRHSPLPPLPIQYVDYTDWQRQRLQGEALNNQLRYWRKQLTGAPPLLALPIDRPRPPVQSTRGTRMAIDLSLSLSDSLKQLSQEEKTTLYVTLLTAFQILMYRYSNQETIVIGTPVSRRNRMETESLVGFFVNMLALRTDLSGELTFRQLLARVHQTALDAYAYQDFPFEKLVEELQPARELSYHPIFQVLFIFFNTPTPDLNLPDLDVQRSRRVERDTARFDLTLSLGLKDDGISGKIEFNVDLFDAETIARMADHFETLLTGIVANPDSPIERLPLLTGAEREQLLVARNRKTETVFPIDSPCIHQHFEAQAARTPQKVAIRFGAESLTYAELNGRVNQLAHYLQKLGVGPNVLVGIAVERSLEMVIGLLGILKAGGAYLPLDPTYPAERLAYMLADSQSPILLTQETIADLLVDEESATDSVTVVCLDRDGDKISAEATTNPRSHASGQHLAYVIYTSGSTGRPKGVQIKHDALINFLYAMAEQPGLTPEDVLLAVTTISFDIAVLELFLPLIVGAQVVVADQAMTRDAAQLATTLATAGITIMQATPVTWRLLIEVGWPGDGRLTMLCGGEALPGPLATQLLSRGGRLWNMYGPTETTIWSAVYEVVSGEASGEASVPVGPPIANTQFYVLDRQQQPVPIGVPGELYIGGAGLAAGYLNRPELTAERFVPNPFVSGGASSLPQRLYKTGDLVRYRADGTLEFLGRIDHQVKIRGFRIELGEIESVLRRHTAVKETIVLAREDVPGDKRLVAYMEPVTEQDAPSNQALRDFLGASLPEYMIPAAFMWLASWPQTPNGKVDRLALAPPDWDRSQQADDFVRPRTTAEKIVAEIWQTVLGIETVGVQDNFFELGGHSLLATQMLYRVCNAFEADIPLRDFMSHPTIAGLVRQAEVAGWRDKPVISPVDREQTLPLSFSQQRLWFLDQLQPNSAAYNIPLLFHMEGDLHVAALERSLNEIAARHETLRTAFVMEGGEPVQKIMAGVTLPLSRVDLSDFDGDRLAEAERLAALEVQKPFDLTQAPLIRATLYHRDGMASTLLIVKHHIISDGWSNGVLIRELAALYEAFAAGRPSPLSPLPIQYVDYAAWQRVHLSEGELNKQIQYWEEQLAGAPELLTLPTDHPRPPIQSTRGARLAINLPSPLSTSLKALSQQENTTLFVTLLTAFKILMVRYASQESVVIGTPVAGRNQVETEDLIGFFVNTLALRTDMSGRMSFRQLLARVHETTFDALAHQELPFEKLVEELQPTRALSYNPIFQVLFVLQNAPTAELTLPGLEIQRSRRLEWDTAKFDLSLSLREHQMDIGGEFEYNVDLFDAETINRMAGHFQMLLSQIVAHPDMPVAELPLLTAVEKEEILVAWNRATDVSYQPACAHHLFEAQVAQTPDALAVQFGDERLTYAELNRRANQLAHTLQKRGVGPEELVGISVTRSLEMVIGLLGILKAGGAYLPLDPTYPVERLAYMLSDSKASVLLTQSHLRHAWPQTGVHIICLDDEWPAIAAASDQNPTSPVTADHLAYVIYTSGSTGKPKGVMVPHRGIGNLAVAQRKGFDMGPDSRVLQFASFSFDASVAEVMATLLTGAALYLAPPEDIMPGKTLADYLRHHAITTITLPPSALAVTPPEDLPALRTVVSAGEACTADVVAQWAPGRRFVNGYGPTESTVCATLGVVEENGRTPPIGRAIDNMQVYVLDAHMQPVPVGVPGELYIGGQFSLARGYLNRPGLTAEKFVPNPFVSRGAEEQGSRGEDSPQRLYKTGDLVRFLPDGNLEFLGRLDHQVKVRGFRIELGEIEAALRRHVAVAEALVLVREDVPGDKRLVAYMVGDQDTLSNQAMREFLHASLPAYMVPAAFVWLESWPLTPNGKVNRRALPLPDYAVDGREAAYVEPRTDVEQRLARIWERVLDVEPIGIHDNFFTLGGHSLLVTQMLSRVRNHFEADISLRDFMSQPTITGLVQLTKTAERRDTAVISAIAREQIFPLSFSQQRLWFLDQLQPGNTAYNMPLLFHIKGNLHVAALERSLKTIMARHETLRTAFVIKEDEPVQKISAEVRFSLSWVDLSDFDGDRLAEAERLAALELQKPFDLMQAPLFRATLYHRDDMASTLFIVTHHIISDGWSNGVLIRELAALYEAFAAGRPSPLSPLPIQYADYAVWQRAHLSADELNKQLQYWKEQLAGAPELLALPTDRSRPPIQSTRGAHLAINLSSELSTALKALSRQENTTLFVTLLTAFKILMFRYAAQESVVIGTPVAGRNQVETEDLIGFFVNTLALRTDVSGQMSFRQLLACVHETTINALDHQDLPFEKLVEELQPARALSYNPIFQALFALQNTPAEELTLPGLEIRRSRGLERDTAKFDLSLSLREREADIRGVFEYNVDLFDAETIARMAGHFQTLLSGIIAHPDIPTAELSLLTAAEREQILVAWNRGTDVPYQPACIHHLFEAQVARTPDAPAVRYDDKRLTYAELNGRANQLAHYLQKLGVGPEVLVGIMVERSMEMIVGLLGILKAGGAYLPLDPAYPAERLSYMLVDSQAAVMVTQAHLHHAWPQTDAHIICMDDEWPEIAAESDENAASPVTAGNLAYVIYTSGSTGKPKGVPVPHRGVGNLAASQIKGFDIRPHSRVLQFASLSFDASVSEIVVALLAGATLYLAPSDALLPGEKLAQFLRQHKITTAKLPPSTLAVTPPDDLPALRTISSAGEACTAEIVAKWAPGRLFVNVYGPTESTVCATLGVVEDNGHTPPIGRAIDNVQVYVLDAHMQPVPVGVPGELYIGGKFGLARGYLNRPELTAERFVPNPFVSRGATPASLRLYKTGDLVRHLPDGNLEFLGRIDHQVKIRGFRIELGEIEAVLRQQPAVGEALVLVREDVPGDKRLVAYIIGEQETGASQALRDNLGASLPPYMIPAAFVWLASWPLTPNGKVNRRALPAPDYAAAGREVAYVEPRTEVEQQLVHIWERVLNVKPIGIHNNFFTLGGHSLLAVQLFAQIEKAFGRTIPVATLFQAPTIAELARFVRLEASKTTVSALVPIQPAGDNPPFFCVHGGAGHVFHYQEMAKYMRDDQPFYGIQPIDWNAHRVTPPRIEALASRYVAEIQAVQPTGPYYLGGFCFGGVIVFEMAQQLRRMGEEVATLALIEPSTFRIAKSGNHSGHGRGRSGNHRKNLEGLSHTQKLIYLLRAACRWIGGMLEQSRRYVTRNGVKNLKRIGLQLYLLTGRPVPHQFRDFYLMEMVSRPSWQRYKPDVYEGELTAFLTDRRVNKNWSKLANKVKIHAMSIDHLGVLKEPHVQEIAHQIQTLIDETAVR